MPNVKAFPAEILTAMLADVAAPPATVADVATAARVKRNVVARVAAPAWHVLDEPGWSDWVPGTQRKTLFDNGVTRSWLVRMEPGAMLPPHEHDGGDEECVVLYGEVRIDGRRLGTGDYTVALKGSRHDTVSALTGALIYLRTPSPRRAAVTP